MSLGDIRSATPITKTRPVTKMLTSERKAKASRDWLTSRYPEHTYEVRFASGRYYVVVLAEEA